MEEEEELNVQQDDESLPPSKYQVPRSCLHCHKRKVRCNKASPCSNCVRLRVPCRYPGPVQGKRRAGKTSISDVSERLARLERTLTALSLPGGAREAAAIVSRDRGIGSSNTESESSQSPSEGILIPGGSSTPYINDLLMSQVLEKERELQSAFRSQTDLSHHSATRATIFGHGLIFQPHRPAASVLDLYPTRWEATQLWQVYTNNVSPVVRILHIPSMQSVVFGAISNTKDIPHDLAALLFSIYFSAVTSLSPEEVATLLKMDRVSALLRYREGLETALCHASFLETPTLPALQAIVLYVTCLRAHHNGRSAWALNGLLIRTAQSMGLHRDGKQFNLTPLDAEIRRRLWWQIVGCDSRAAEDHGLYLDSGFEMYAADTQMPANIDDSDLSASTTVLPPDKPHWTETSISLMTCAMSKMLREVTRPPGERTQSAPQVLRDFKTRLYDVYLYKCDMNVPIQRASVLLGNLLILKVEFMVYQQALSRDTAENHPSSEAAEQALLAAVGCLEAHSKLVLDDLCRSFLWLLTTYIPYYVLTYILWHLCVHPGCANLERAWTAVDISFYQIEHLTSTPMPGPKWAILRHLKDKANQLRRQAENKPCGDAAQVLPDRGAPRDGIPEDSLDPLHWDIDPMLFTDWSDFAQTFNMQYFDTHI
ncbi:hypothetical protein ASPZODRAFT_70052 [Penicilliopsis zonata CBS 506.65]|uniref:Zn(2)-C6 fungal-type domain-containing protein n=1 Tax=Penicilliopsis zonata CBS 506.65 TaxID=1073090 RepID=A0A1L9SDJ4_9EURO|nr:hypothetical protein ASPZODRAFT_70052 [Penicilliopsis zonata CBS 506.65]OJJ45251.1 hypothetical protein ASPZODRAFT_70052 [Penicilliopsis zonata CBS 506.65]